MYERLNKSTFEASVENHRKIVKLGNLAICRYENLGINDPLTHLYNYLDKGEEAIVGIREDIETDIAERLPNVPFLNTVSFVCDGDDFISFNEKSSMRKMTENNLYKMQKLKSVDGKFDDLEIERAKIEVAEISKINNWFKKAEIGSYLIFESLPINNQKIAISRIYQKVSSSVLNGNYVSLHNPSIDRINKLRSNYGADLGRDEIDILSKCYVADNKDKSISNNFIVQYVKKYDEILFRETNKPHYYGIVKNGDAILGNSIEKIRKQKKLINIYLDAIRSISLGEGYANGQIVEIADKLELERKCSLGQCLSINDVRGLLGDVIYGLTSAVDRADDRLLNQIQSDSISSGSEYGFVSIYSSRAKNDGANYNSKACPEYINASQSGSVESETRKIQKAYNLLPNDSFGEASIGVCVVENCPSHGEIKWNPKSTLVGSCSVCVDCHKIYSQGKDPKSIYDKQLKQVA